MFPLDPRIYTDTQTRPVYNEPLEKADVPVEAAWDKISFRENWDPDGQYLLLDGLGRGKHMHFDTNSISTFVQDGERWLLDHDYLTRNTTEHSMLSVLRDGRSTRLVPSLAGLAAAGDLPAMAATHTYVKDYNGVDWRRRVLWSKGRWFLVEDTATAREPGFYDLDLTWKTIDRGHQRLDDQDRFVAERPDDKAGGAAGVFHIDPVPVARAWITNYVRQGIPVPVSVLHQRQSRQMKAGDGVTFCSLLYATGAKHHGQFKMGSPGPHRYWVMSEQSDEQAGFGSGGHGGWHWEGDAWLADGLNVSVVVARRLAHGQTGVDFEPAASVQLETSHGYLAVVATEPTTLTARGGARVGGKEKTPAAGWQAPGRTGEPRTRQNDGGRRGLGFHLRLSRAGKTPKT